MKKLFFLVGFKFVWPSCLAQKFGYIDTEFITSKMPEYQKVQVKMDEMTKQWIKEIEAKRMKLTCLSALLN